MAPQNITADSLFGPQYGDEFDFTLSFQELIFTFIPTIVSIALTPFGLWAALREPVAIRTSFLFWVKLVCILFPPPG